MSTTSKIMNVSFACLCSGAIIGSLAFLYQVKQKQAKEIAKYPKLLQELQAKVDKNNDHIIQKQEISDLLNTINSDLRFPDTPHMNLLISDRTSKPYIDIDKTSIKTTTICLDRNTVKKYLGYPIESK